MNDTQITVQGFVGGVVSLKRAGETEVATFRLGCTPRHYSRRTEQWVDAQTQWYTVKAWRGMARNVAESLVKGDAVTVVGRLTVSVWGAPDGSERMTLEIEASAVGPDLRHGTARLVRHEKQEHESPQHDEQEQVEPTAAADAPADPVSDWRPEPSAA